ncbi:MAG: S8 family serine peptidase, partial [Phycisphaerales bacterium]|nr:S8 family serine peptidase [Phycisphaerales bacterium]
MTRRTIALMTAVLATGATAPASAGDDCFGIPVDARIDELAIVTIASGSSLGAFTAAFHAAHPDVGLVVEDQVPTRETYLIRLDLPPGSPPGFLDLLEEEIETGYPVELLSGDFLYANRTAEGHTGSTWVSGVSPASYTGQYAGTVMGLTTAHARATGRGVVVAIVDTGIDPTHPVLAGRIATGGYDFIDDDDDPDDTGNGADDDDDFLVDEMLGHGTFVAGLVALTAPEARILPVRVLEADGVGDSWTLTRGIYHAIDRGVEVINLSLGSTYDSATVKQAIAEAARLGITVTASAGNFDQSECRERPAMDDIDFDEPVFPPIAIAGALGVAALDHADVKASFSNYNRRLRLSAPGDSIGADADPATSIISIRPDGDYAAWRGTSFATALVSGAAAVVRSQHPEWPANLATYFAVQSVLEGTAAGIYDVNPAYAAEMSLGVGRVDLAAAAASGPVMPPPG